MIAFEVSANGKKVCTDGIGSVGVLTAILSWVRRDSDLKSPYPDQDWPIEELKMEIGGLRGTESEGHESLKWAADDLRLGDVITIRVVETDAVDEPPVKTRDDPEEVERHRRAYYEELKRKYGDAPA